MAEDAAGGALRSVLMNHLGEIEGDVGAADAAEVGRAVAVVWVDAGAVTPAIVGEGVALGPRVAVGAAAVAESIGGATAVRSA